MTHRRLRVGLFIAIWVMCCGSPRDARAWIGIPQEPSLEWAVEASQLVIRGTVRPGMQREMKRSGTLAMREITVDISETIKGTPRQQVKFLMIQPLAGTENTWVDVLVFLNPATSAAGANAGSGDVEMWEPFASCVFDLGRPESAMVRMDETRVTGEALLEAARAAAKYSRERAEPCESMSLWSNSRSLIVPKDRRMEEQARRWTASPQWHLRDDAVVALWHFKSPENAQILRRLMVEDPAYQNMEVGEWTPRIEARAYKRYPVRARAQETLDAWHERRGDAQSVLPWLRYELISWRWFTIAAIALLTIGVVAWWRRGAGTFAVIVCLGLILAIGLAWWQSRRESRAYSFARGAADWEIVSSARGVSVLRVQDDAPPHGWMVRRCDSPEVWFASLLSSTQATGRWGLNLEEGFTSGSGHYSYRLLQSPYWMLMAAFALWPFLWTIGQIRRAARRRRRIARNCCGQCGYDLRGSGGSGGAGRCPECGAGIHRSQ
jgi:hypothetical protein